MCPQCSCSACRAPRVARVLLMLPVLQDYFVKETEFVDNASSDGQAARWELYWNKVLLVRVCFFTGECKFGCSGLLGTSGCSTLQCPREVKAPSLDVLSPGMLLRSSSVMPSALPRVVVAVCCLVDVLRARECFLR